MPLQPALLSLAGIALHSHLWMYNCYPVNICTQATRRSVDSGLVTDANVPLLYGDNVPRHGIVRQGMQIEQNCLQPLSLRQHTTPQTANDKARACC